jgi:hypothetical protein
VTAVAVAVEQGSDAALLRQLVPNRFQPRRIAGQLERTGFVAVEGIGHQLRHAARMKYAAADPRDECLSAQGDHGQAGP